MEPSTSSSQKACPTWIAALLVSLLVLGGVGGVVYYRRQQSSSDNAPALTNETATNTPSTTVVSTFAPTTTFNVTTTSTEPPTFAPTSAPVLTSTPTSVPTTTRDYLVGIIVEAFPSSSDFSNNTHANQALEWMVTNDTLWLPSETTTTRLLQRFALACFWFATNGDRGGWGDWQADWMTATTDECTWTGITCDDQGTVTSLNHNSNYDLQLTGIVPSEIGLLTDLISISCLASLTGTIPTEIGLLTNLQDIELYHDYTSDLPGRLSGQLPKELFDLTTLKEIRFPRNTLGGTLPTAIGQLTNLEILSLYQNDIGGTIPTELGLCTQLRGLFLYGNNNLAGLITCATFVDLRTDAEIDCARTACDGDCCCQGYEDSCPPC